MDGMVRIPGIVAILEKKRIRSSVIGILLSGEGVERGSAKSIFHNRRDRPSPNTLSSVLKSLKH